MNPLTQLRRHRSPRAAQARATFRLELEPLEERLQPSTTTTYESIDGTGNNLAHPTWGSVGQDLLRTAPAQYADGVSALGGTTRPDPRIVSEVVATDSTDGNLPNSRAMSDWVYAWGQFIDHDIDLTSDGTGSQLDPANIAVPTGDPYFDPNSTGTQVITFNRSEYDPSTGTGPTNPRQQINDITAWIDGSQIYGSDPATADSLRTHVGGQLKTSAGDLLPIDPNSGLFLAGDIRADENSELTAVQTLFVREHNRIASLIQQANPSLDDETIYQQARAIVVAEEQAITFNEFLPALLGTGAIAPYRGYNPNVNPGIANEFSTAAYRFGHSLVASDVQFLNNDGTTEAPSASLASVFFNPQPIEQNGIDPILKYLSSDNAQEVDTKIVPELQNFLFGQPGQGGMDLASLNIQRGRDHGLADYNTTRAAYGLPKVTSFAQITSNPQLQAELKQLYGNVNNIDLWVGGLAEDHVPGSSVGPLFQRIIANQFQRIRAGDRYWFENQFSGPALNALEHTTLEQIIARNTGVTNLQANVFFFRIGISGTVFNDANHDGLPQLGERGLAGQTVQLLNADTGAVVATTTTDARGNYQFNQFNGLTLGSFEVVVVPSSGWTATATAASQPVFTLTRGDAFVTGVNLGVASTQPQGTPAPPPPRLGGQGWGQSMTAGPALMDAVFAPLGRQNAPHGR